MSESLRLRIPCRWEEIDGVREQVDAFLAAHRIPRPHQDAVTMTSCELSENGIKYSGQPADSGWLELEVSVGQSDVTVEVRHPVSDDQLESLERLDRMVQWIRGHQDPFEAYMDRLREVSAQSLEHPESGLGLVRIAYEGQSVLDFYLDENQVLAVSAVHAL